jgi:hypothetical protein
VKNFIMRHPIPHSGEHKTAAAHDAMADMGMGAWGETSERENYWLIATPLKPAAPIGLDVAAGVRSP